MCVGVLGVGSRCVWWVWRLLPAVHVQPGCPHGGVGVDGGGGGVGNIYHWLIPQIPLCLCCLHGKRQFGSC